VNNDESQIGYLERWELPFSNVAHPSVSVIIPPDCFNRIKVIVMPKGLEKYPGYLLDFRSAPFFMFYDETCAPPLSIPPWFDVGGTISPSSTVIWHDSPLVKKYAGIGGSADPREKLKHYLILGGDSIAEVLAYEEPSVEQFNEHQKITMEYSV
jgi:hypothetical protein